MSEASPDKIVNDEIRPAILDPEHYPEDREAGKGKPLNQDAKRIRIAEACGWTSLHDNYDGDKWGRSPDPRQRSNDNVIGATPLPDYFNDLNAMHEAEKTLGEPRCYDYVDNLPRHYTGRTNFALAHATAAERAEAFGLTLELWK